MRRALGVVKSVIQFRQMSGLLIFGDSKVFLLIYEYIVRNKDVVNLWERKPGDDSKTRNLAVNKFLKLDEMVYGFIAHGIHCDDAQEGDRFFHGDHKIWVAQKPV